MPIRFYDKDDLEKLWLPDSFASNAKDERLTSDTEVLEMVELSMVTDNKCVIEYWSKLKAKLSCSLNFQYYPFDKQYCNMSIRNCKFSHFHIFKVFYLIIIFLFKDAVNEKLLKYKFLKNDHDWRGEIILRLEYTFKIT